MSEQKQFTDRTMMVERQSQEKNHNVSEGFQRGSVSEGFRPSTVLEEFEKVLEGFGGI